MNTYGTPRIASPTAAHRGARFILIPCCVLSVLVYFFFLYIPSQDDRYIGSGASDLFFVFGSIIESSIVFVFIYAISKRVLLSMFGVFIIFCFGICTELFIGADRAESIWLGVVADVRDVLGYDRGDVAAIVVYEKYFDFCAAILVYNGSSSQISRANTVRDLVIDKLRLQLAHFKTDHPRRDYTSFVGCNP